MARRWLIAVALCIGCREEPSVVAPRDANVVEANVEASVVDASVSVSIDAGPTAAFADASLVDMVSDAIALLDQIGNIIAANSTDCEVMSARLDEFRLKHLDGVAEVSAIYDPEHKTELRQLQPQFRARFKNAWKKVRPGVVKCNHAVRMKQVIHDIWGDADWSTAPDAG